jgi:hypothetical protein
MKGPSHSRGARETRDIRIGRGWMVTCSTTGFSKQGRKDVRNLCEACALAKKRAREMKILDPTGGKTVAELMCCTTGG